MKRLAFIKDNEKYLYIYDDTDARCAELFHVLERQAKDKDLSLTCYDAVVISQRVRREAKKNMAQNILTD